MTCAKLSLFFGMYGFVVGVFLGLLLMILIYGFLKK